MFADFVPYSFYFYLEKERKFAQLCRSGEVKLTTIFTTHRLNRTGKRLIPYYQQGLVSRIVTDKRYRRYKYSIKNRGVKKMEFLQNKELISRLVRKAIKYDLKMHSNM
jgi:hypothetical protein